MEKGGRLLVQAEGTVLTFDFRSAFFGPVNPDLVRGPVRCSDPASWHGGCGERGPWRMRVTMNGHPTASSDRPGGPHSLWIVLGLDLCV